MTDEAEAASGANEDPTAGGEIFRVSTPWTWLTPVTAEPGESMVPVRVHSDAARAFASLNLVDGDLAFAADCLFKADERGRPDDSDVDSKALIFSGVVAYARCFVSGVRVQQLKPDILAASAAEFDLQTHDYLIDLRNKHVAHSVNDFEDAEAFGVLYVMPPGRIRDGGAVGVTIKQTVGLSRTLLRKALANIASARVFLANDLEVRRRVVYEEFKEAIARGDQFERAAILKATDRSNVSERRPR